MEKEDPKQNRLLSLDGVRGLAILMVFLNHINSQPIIESSPKLLRPIVEAIFSSGLVGVSLLFILSGFLMAYIYPEPTSYQTFLQKRYTRIFPLFLTMASVMMIFKLIPHLYWVFRLGIIFICALTTHVVWVYGVRKIHKAVLGKTIFIGFICLQCVIVLWYAGWVMRHTALSFNQLTHPFIREATIYLVNATLTLPLGNYISMLDGVYWSLAAEVLFYILYPIICVPLVNLLRTKPTYFKVTFLILLIPFFAGLYIISKNMFTLSMLQLYYFYYFVAGITLAYLFRNKKELIEKCSRIFDNKATFLLPVLLFFAFIVWQHVLVNKISFDTAVWLRIGWAIPFTFLIALSLDARTSLHKFFNNKALLYLGTISYSVYLSHTALVDTAKKVFIPTAVLNNIQFIGIVLAGTIITASILFWLLERPYFIRSKSGKEQMNKDKVVISTNYFKFTVVLTLVYSFILFIAYQSNFSFTSIEQPHKLNVIAYPRISSNLKILSMGQYPDIKMVIPAEQNNLGIVTMNLHYKFQPTKNNVTHGETQFLEFNIKEHNASQWYFSSKFSPNEIGNSPNHPFGFPEISNSKGKLYDIELNLSDPNRPEIVDIDTSSSIVKSVYRLNKADFIKNPPILFSLVIKRIIGVVENKMALNAFLLTFPIMVLIYISQIFFKKRFSK